MGVLDKSYGGLTGSYWAVIAGVAAIGLASEGVKRVRGSQAGRWVESQTWDVVGARTGFHMAWDGYLKSNIPYRSPWSSKSAARENASAEYDSLVSNIAAHYGVSDATVRKEVGGKRDWLAMVSEGDW